MGSLNVVGLCFSSVSNAGIPDLHVLGSTVVKAPYDILTELSFSCGFYRPTECRYDRQSTGKGSKSLSQR